MPYTTYQSIDLPGYPGLVGTIGYTVFNYASGIVTARQTTNIIEIISNENGLWCTL